MSSCRQRHLRAFCEDAERLVWGAPALQPAATPGTYCYTIIHHEPPHTVDPGCISRCTFTVALRQRNFSGLVGKFFRYQFLVKERRFDRGLLLHKCRGDFVQIFLADALCFLLLRSVPRADLADPWLYRVQVKKIVGLGRGGKRCPDLEMLQEILTQFIIEESNTGEFTGSCRPITCVRSVRAQQRAGWAPTRYERVHRWISCRPCAEAE